ncbi:hypothetical protein F4859DRAFT_519050 [Xylaria cf. heliscus]|nr:hypothetical protein F4859DRAFT_519050 [Xylaria cf. heliscus]
MASLRGFDGHSSEEEVNPHVIAGKRLPWFGNPVVYEDKIRSPADSREFDELQEIAYSSQHYNVNTVPRFEKHEASSTLEVFYDLWFVANLTIFTTLHTVNDRTTLWSYVGYISILWFDWCLVSLYDVRYLADSVAERVGRAIHMAVMIGFAVVSVHFTPDQQSSATFQVTSLALAVSRLSLAIRYLSIIWHIRHFKQGKYPLIAVAAINFISAWIYFGISFSFTDDKNSHAFIVWYVIGAVETLLQLGLSLYFKVLSFNGTHLTERMTVSTLFMLEEGIHVLAENVVTIVENNGWTPATIGNLTAGVSNVFFVFMVYFDWMANHESLSGIRQSLWTIFHFPFHILLLLFMQGSTQFVQWWKILEALQWAADQFSSGAANVQNTDNNESPTQSVVDLLNSTVTEIFEKYEPTYSSTESEIDQVLQTIATIPDDWWSEQGNTSADAQKYQTLFDNSIDELSTAVSNSILVNFKIDPIQEIAENDPSVTTNTQLQSAALQQTSDRFTLSFQFTFISAGLTLLLMTILFVIGRPRRSWSISVAIRVILFFIIGIALSLVALVSRNDNSPYLDSPWLLPTLALVYFVVLILTHFPRRPPPETFAFWRRVRLRARKAAKETDANSEYRNVRGDHSVGAYTAYEGKRNSSGQPTHVSTYPSETSGEQPCENHVEKTS